MHAMGQQQPMEDGLYTMWFSGELSDAQVLAEHGSSTWHRLLQRKARDLEAKVVMYEITRNG